IHDCAYLRIDFSHMDDQAPNGAAPESPWRKTMATKFLAKALLATCALTALMGSVAAQEFDYGKFDGYTLKVKLIGGTQYEKLYTRIPEWEALTGAKVE